jgi:hypothetical protein
VNAQQVHLERSGDHDYFTDRDRVRWRVYEVGFGPPHAAPGKVCTYLLKSARANERYFVIADQLSLLIVALASPGRADLRARGADGAALGRAGVRADLAALHSDANGGRGAGARLYRRPRARRVAAGRKREDGGGEERDARADEHRYLLGR